MTTLLVPPHISSAAPDGERALANFLENLARCHHGAPLINEATNGA